MSGDRPFSAGDISPHAAARWGALVYGQPCLDDAGLAEMRRAMAYCATGATVEREPPFSPTLPRHLAQGVDPRRLRGYVVIPEGVCLVLEPWAATADEPEWRVVTVIRC